jgi:hypothetical protein
LKEVVQPNAAADCSDKCGGESGWCNFCGGTHEGACCKKGDGGVCSQFDVPIGWHNSKYHACVHNDCVQKNTGYYATKLKEFGARANGGSRTVEECQQLCQTVRDGEMSAQFFTLNEEGKKCTCLGAGATRHQEAGAFSGPVQCKQITNSIKQQEEEWEDTLNQTVSVPMQELEPCDKSPVVSTFADVEANHMDWVKSCYSTSTKTAIIEYNRFYEKFAKFVDMLSWKAGCGTTHEISWGYTAKDGNGMEAVSENFDAGTFSECNWNVENRKDDNMRLWRPDDTGTRGITGTSRYAPEQKDMKTPFPMPSWLHDLRNVQGCLQSTAAGDVTNANNGAASAISEATRPADWSNGRVTESNQDAEYDELLRQAMER